MKKRKITSKSIRCLNCNNFIHKNSVESRKLICHDCNIKSLLDEQLKNFDYEKILYNDEKDFEHIKDEYKNTLDTIRNIYIKHKKNGGTFFGFKQTILKKNFTIKHNCCGINSTIKDNALDVYESMCENGEVSLVLKSKQCKLCRNEYMKSYYSQSEIRLISRQLRSVTANAFKRKGFVKSKKTEELLGCSVEEARKHIEKQFVKGMSWDNYGVDVWHIDHIIPLSSAKTKEDVERLCKWQNLQPLFATENRKKSGKSPLISRI
jgi:hypothetical protein